MQTKQRPKAKCNADLSGGVNTKLHIAALEGEFKQIKLLLRSGNHDLNATGERQFTALHFAANAGHLEVCHNKTDFQQQSNHDIN